MQDVSIPDFCYEVAPRDLGVQRTDRYRGDRMSVRLDEFRPDDQTATRALYRQLSDAHERVRRVLEEATLGTEHVQAVGQWPEWNELVIAARQIDGAMRGYDERKARVLHDIRGGSLAALIGSASLLPFTKSPQNDLLRCAYFARDHLKIMRNCVSDIDPVAAEHDRATRAHHVRLLTEKWSQGWVVRDGVRCRVAFACAYEGNLSERCLEFSALDRVIYNLVNNAARHTADGELGFAILPVGAGAAQHARFVIWNAISAAHGDHLRELLNGDLARLMVEGGSTTGGGLGLRICGEFVQHAFGLRSVTEVVQRGYAGVRVDGGRFVSWFHWPSLN